MDVIIKGFVTKVLPLEEGVSPRTGNPWARQSVVLQHEAGQYPKSIVFDVSGKERINNMAFTEGEEVTVHLGINTREYQGKFFNQVECCKVERGQQAQAAPAPQAAPQQQDGGDLPF